MKNLKKAAAVLTAAAVSMSMGMTALAESITTQNGSRSTSVYGKYETGESGGIVYTVDVTWGNLLFTYNASGNGTWQPDSHTYAEGSEAGWTGSPTITVTNHSNAVLEATPTFAPYSSYPNVTASFTNLNENGALYLSNAADGESYGNVDKAPTAETVMTLSGDPGEFDSTKILGTVSVVIKDVE